MTLLLGTVELSRRAVWALFRLEWEQILRVAVEEHKDNALYKSSSVRRASLSRPLLPAGNTSKEERIEAQLSRNVRRMASGVWPSPSSSAGKPGHPSDGPLVAHS